MSVKIQLGRDGIDSVHYIFFLHYSSFFVICVLENYELFLICFSAIKYVAVGDFFSLPSENVDFTVGD
jgi:hypothetical protein